MTCKVGADAFDRKKLVSHLNKFAIATEEEIQKIVGKVEDGLPDQLTPEELVNYVAKIISSLSLEVEFRSDVGLLAGNVLMDFLIKNTQPSFTSFCTSIDRFLTQSFKDDLAVNGDRINELICRQFDYTLDLFAVSTLFTSYLIKDGKKVVERPSYLFMRAAIAMHKTNFSAIESTYRAFINREIMHASPTLFNCGLKKGQLSSCFLMPIKNDSIYGIFKTLGDCAAISQRSGGIGLSVSNIRAKGASIMGVEGRGSGIAPMLKGFDWAAHYVDQGGKRPGAIAVYLEPWHADIFDFLNLPRKVQVEENACKNLFLGLWVPDLFMEKVRADEDWCLFCPTKAPGLDETFGIDFEWLYNEYEAMGVFVKKVKARELFGTIMKTQIECGFPFMLYKDACNSKSNQKNLGVIKCSNLCTEIIQYSDEIVTGTCNLATISLPSCVINGKLDYSKIQRLTSMLVENLNKIINNTYYPLQSARSSNYLTRPMGIGVQGLADVFAMLRIPFESIEAKQINRLIFENIYYAALKKSCLLAQRFGHYPSYNNSPISKNILQFDMWGADTTLDWAELRSNIRQFGVYNSLLVAQMPTASTAQIVGNNESVEPVTSNVLIRSVLCGEFKIVSKHLKRILLENNLWTSDTINILKRDLGSVQNINGLGDDLKQVFKTVWEIDPHTLLEMAADRGAFIDQSQSQTVWLTNPTHQRLGDLHFKGYNLGLKTGMYYLRTQAAVQPIQITCTSCSS